MLPGGSGVSADRTRISHPVRAARQRSAAVPGCEFTHRLGAAGSGGGTPAELAAGDGCGTIRKEQARAAADGEVGCASRVSVSGGNNRDGLPTARHLTRVPR